MVFLLTCGCLGLVVMPHSHTLRSLPVMAAIDEANRPPPPLPALLEAWGCDATLWSEIKQKQSLIKLAASGDEEHARKRLDKLRAIIAEAKAEPDDPEKTARKAFLRDGVRSKKKVRTPNRSDGPYKRYGRIPSGIKLDVVEVDAMVAERAACKISKDYSRADELRLALRGLGGDEGWGVKVRDDTRTWYVSKEKPTMDGTPETKPAKQRVTAENPPEADAGAEVEEGAGAVPNGNAAPPSPETEPRAMQVERNPKDASSAPMVTDAAPAPAGFDWGATF